MRLRFLGPFEVGPEGASVGGPMERAVLAVLAIHANEVVSTQRLVDLLWDENPPKTARKVVQMYVSRLRRVLASDAAGTPRISTKAPGYLMRLQPDEFDVHVFERLAGEGHRALAERDFDAAAVALTEALRLWRGEPLAEFAHLRFAEMERARLEELRASVIEDRIEAELGRGRHVEIVADVEAAVAQFPRRETIIGQAMLTLYRCGRQADALELYRAVRAAFVDELGIEPGAALAELEAKILKHDDSLRWQRPDLAPPVGNLAEPTTSFIGRAVETARVRVLLAASRILTITGPGGCGKSRLAIEVAAALRSGYPHGVWVVDLSSVHEGAPVIRAICSVLGVREQPPSDAFDAVVAHLRNKTLLLLLDNCEHVVANVAELVDLLRRSCPGVRLLVTSREPLAVHGEVSFPVAPLPVPVGAVSRLSDLPDAADAVRLFAARAAASQPQFRLDDDTVSAVVRICSRLDGIPLAIELAAARVRTMSLHDLAARVDDALDLLTGGSRTAAARHKTLRAAIDWSHRLLTARERQVLARLAVFAGGFTLARAAAVCRPPQGADDTVDVVLGLVDKSLVVIDDRAGEARYRLLETIREYAAEELAKEGLTDETADLHAAEFLALAEAAEPELRGAQQRAWLRRLDCEHQNLNAALLHVRSHGDAEATLRLSATLWRYWYLRGRYAEGRAALRGALGMPGGSLSARAFALTGAGALAFYQCDYNTAEEHCREALAAFRRLHDGRGMANALTLLGAIARERGDYARAKALHGEALAIFRRLGDRWGEAHSLQMHGFAAWLSGSYGEADTMSRHSLIMLRELRDDERSAWALMDLGAVAHYQGEQHRAADLLRRSLSLFERLGFKEGIAWSLNLAALVELERDDVGSAQSMLVQSLSLHKELGDRWRLGSVLEVLARVAHVAGDSKTAVRVLGAADALRASIGTPVPHCERRAYDALQQQLRRALGEPAFEEEWRFGELLTPEDACDLVREWQTSLQSV